MVLIECGDCEKQVDHMSIWLCRRNGVDYCNRCIVKQIPSETFKAMLKERGDA